MYIHVTSQQLQYLIQPVNIRLVHMIQFIQLWECGFPGHGSNFLVQVLKQKSFEQNHHAECLFKRDWPIAIEMEWAWLW